MEEIKLPSGKTITLDLSKVTHKEFVKFWKGRGDNLTEQEQKERDDFDSQFVLKVCGLTSNQIENFPQPDWRAFDKAFVKFCFPPLEEAAKNSPSASTIPTL